jgi:hypothetical protein
MSFAYSIMNIPRDNHCQQRETKYIKKIKITLASIHHPEIDSSDIGNKKK